MPILTEVPRPQDCARTQRRYLHHPAIEFRTNRWLGIRLSDALENSMEGLAEPDSQAMVTPGVKVTYLIEVSVIIVNGILVSSTANTRIHYSGSVILQ